MKIKYNLILVNRLMAILGILLTVSVFPVGVSAFNDDYLTGGHPYLLLNGGISFLDIPSTQIGFISYKFEGGIYSRGTDFMFDTGGGYLWYNNRFAYGIEATYNDYSENKNQLTSESPQENYIPNLNYQVSNVNLLAVGEYFLDPNFYVVAKVGPAYVMQKTIYYDDYSTYQANYQSANRNRFAIAADLGVGAYFTQHVGIDLGIANIFGGRSPAALSYSNNDFNAYNRPLSLFYTYLGVTYRF